MKKIFIWKYVNELTDAYHGGGGLVIVAEEQPTTWHLDESYGSRTPKDVPLPEPDAVYALTDGDIVDDETFLFPDAGCC